MDPDSNDETALRRVRPQCVPIHSAGMTAGWILLALVVLLTAWLGVIRRGLLRLHAAEEHAWARVAALLQERNAELAAFAQVCGRCLPEEQAGIDRLLRTAAAVRTAAASRDLPALAGAEHLLQAALERLRANAATSQKLLADAAASGLLERLERVQQSLAEQRELHDAALNLLQLRRRQFPERVAGRTLGLRPGGVPGPGTRR